MNCHDFERTIDPYLDLELDSNQRSSFEAHLRDCSICRQKLQETTELNGYLERALAIEDIQDQVAAIDRRIGMTEPTVRLPDRLNASSRQRNTKALCLAGLLLVSVVAWWWLSPIIDLTSISRTPESKVGGLARLTRTVGTVEIQSPSQDGNSARSQAPSESLQAGDRVTTSEDSLCEMEFENGTIVRLRPNSEVELISPGEAVVHRGAIYVRTHTDDIRIHSPQGSTVPLVSDSKLANETFLQCPADQAIQCTLNDQQFLCQSIASPSINSYDRLSMILWQLPLLDDRADDTGLLGQLISVLPDDSIRNAKAVVGDLKLSLFVDSEIRQMGPVAALPLLAYVRSELSTTEPGNRLRAMRLGCEIADSASLDHLLALKDDSDESIRQLAIETIGRLKNI